MGQEKRYRPYVPVRYNPEVTSVVRDWPAWDAEVGEVLSFSARPVDVVVVHGSGAVWSKSFEAGDCGKSFIRVWEVRCGREFEYLTSTTVRCHMATGRFRGLVGCRMVFVAAVLRQMGLVAILVGNDSEAHAPNWLEEGPGGKAVLKKNGPKKKDEKITIVSDLEASLLVAERAAARRRPNAFPGLPKKWRGGLPVHTRKRKGKRNSGWTSDVPMSPG